MTKSSKDLITNPEAWRDHISSALGDLYPAREAKHLANMALEDITGLSQVDLLVGKYSDLEAPVCEALTELLEKLQTGMPYQYALGRANFYGLHINVDPAVLIPRPETEELVKWVLDDHDDTPLRVLDCCTGSGCIALALKNQRPKWQVSACDISPVVIIQAEKNTLRHGLDVSCFQADVFGWTDLPAEKLDIIVSNPPYVRQSEASLMNKNVVDFEPHLALFVPDDDAIKFYRQIAKLGTEMLNQNGLIYFEINEGLSEEVASELRQNGYDKVELRKDMNGKMRMVKARLC